jgi:predicted phosphodiesterase
MNIKTLVLRFRDLSTNDGQTIHFHKNKIDEYKYVWWGWWNKAGETIPSETFRLLMSTIRKDGFLDIFLFDTGTAKLYPAKLEEIKWDPCYQSIESPNWEATPDYYEKRTLKAWFKIKEISDGITDKTILNKWSYVEVDELFETKKSIFHDFNGKQISSFEELRHQETTIWFIRPFKKGDEIREILLYDTSRVKPSSFPTNIIESHSTKILWLSDLHFSKNNKHAFPLKNQSQTGNTLAEAIRKDLEDQKIQKIGGIIITGDLTWEASEEEFIFVRTFLDDIMSWSTLTPNQIILCPGNHDIAYSDKPWEKGTLVDEATEESRKNFEKFYSDFFSTVPNLYLASGRRILLARSFVIEIASLNSSYLRQTETVFQGHGYISEEQRNFVANEMLWSDQDADIPHPFRIVLLHHHLVPVIPEDLAKYEQHPSLVYDAGSLCSWIVKHKVNLVLHGHMHHTKVVKEARSLGLIEGNTQWHEFIIASLGTTGVDLNHNLLDRRNVYGLLDFSNKGLNLKIREINSKDTDRPVEPTIVNIDIPCRI